MGRVPVMRRIALLACALVLAAPGCVTRPLVTIADQPASHAWWLRARFEPGGTRFRGLHVGALHPAWCAIGELLPEHFEEYERADGRDPAAPDAARYSVHGPYVDGRSTRVSLVAYRECAGATGTALVLFHPAMKGVARTIAVEPVASPAAYAMLRSSVEGEVHVMHCQDCDAIDIYRWEATGRRWVALPDPEDGEP